MTLRSAVITIQSHHRRRMAQSLFRQRIACKLEINNNDIQQLDNNIVVFKREIIRCDEQKSYLIGQNTRLQQLRVHMLFHKN